MQQALRFAAVALLVSLDALAQPSAAPAFEVASVRSTEGPRRSLNMFSSSGPRATFEGYSIRDLVIEAYSLKNYQLSGVFPLREPEYTYYDIVAKAEGNAPHARSEFRLMLQSLLAERFKLQIHREQKEMDVYALLVGKSGPKFKQSAPDADPIAKHGVNGRNQGISAAAFSMEALASGLSIYVPGMLPVLDRTGLTGTYGVKFEATPAFRLQNGEPQLDDISVFAAVQDQLGLKLERQKAMVEVLVIGHVEHPTSN
jgi:uncharacterized protein (TIGR03435 family)